MHAMAFVPINAREDEHGQWTIFQYSGAPIAQVFLPKGRQPGGEFAFFWLGSAQAEDMHKLIDVLIDTARTHVSGRIVGPFGVSTFAFAPKRDDTEHSHAWNAGVLHHTIDHSIQPYNLGMTVETRDGPRLLSHLYLWASVGALQDDTPAFPEIGIRTTFADWSKPSVSDIIRQLFRERSHFVFADRDVDDLWQQIAVTTQANGGI